MQKNLQSYIHSNLVLIAAGLLAGTLMSSAAFATTIAKLYQDQCASCHGANGKGGNLGAHDNPVQPFHGIHRDTIERRLTIKDTRVPEHGVARLLSAKDLRALIAYVEQLSR
jgi:mono/diheme cytochrome c family protein